MSTRRHSRPYDEELTDAQRFYNQVTEIRRLQTIVATHQGDTIAHLLIGAVLGGGLVLLARWQADPLIRWLDDVCTALGWTAAGR